MTRLVCVLLFVTPLVAGDDVRLALESFQQAKYSEAATHFAKAESLSPEQKAAWAYCRVRLAAELWNGSRGDAAGAKRVVAEVSSALVLAPDYPELQKFGREVITAAGGTPPVIAKPVVDSGWYSLESDNFRVRFPQSAKDFAEAVSRTAEEQRGAIFSRWSGPPSGAWSVKCEIVIHANAAEFAKATNLNTNATGHALIQMESGKPSHRRIDLRADDETAAMDALPRELTHVVLGDLFPSQAPPKWAAEGMAILAMSPGTVDRYLKTANSQAKKGELPTASSVLDADKGSIVASAALVEFLAKQKGDRSLTVFLRDSKRYGLEKSLERQFGYTFKTIDTAWSAALKN